MPEQPGDASIKKMQNFVDKYCEKSGTFTHPTEGITEQVVLGLARYVEELGRPLCPCRFYPDKKEEVSHRTWICACDDMQIYKYCHCLLFVNKEGMQIYKYCHCLLFVNKEGLPITEYLPEDHEGRAIYGLVEDPTGQGPRPPESGRGPGKGT